MNDELKWRSRVRNVCLTQADLEQFTEALRARFPKLYMFERNSLTNSIAELENIGQGHRQIEILPHPPWPQLDPGNIQLGENTSLKFGDRYNDSVEIWRSEIRDFDMKNIWSGSLTRPIDAVVRRLFPSGFIRGSYQTKNEDKKRFIQSVLYLAGKFMTNDFDVYDLETGKRHHMLRQSLLWAGPDAMRLGETDRDFYCVVYFDGDLNTWVGYKAIPRVRKRPRKKKRGTE